MRSLSAGFAGLALISSGALGAQERAAAPTDVAVVADGAAAVVTWTPVPVDGVMYRVARTLDSRRAPVDVTTEPVDQPKFYDTRIQAGVTYFYQVIAVYRNTARLLQLRSSHLPRRVLRRLRLPSVRRSRLSPRSLRFAWPYPLR